MLFSYFLGMAADLRRNMRRERSRKVGSSRSSEIVPELRPLLYAGSSKDSFQLRSKIRICSDLGEDVFRSVFRFQVKFQKLRPDLREQGDRSDCSPFVMFRR